MNTRSTCLAVVGALCFLGCKKDNSTPEVDAAFNTQFTLSYAQRANLPTQASPELSITVDDIADTRCPPTVNCIQAGNVQTTVSITEQTGAKQTVTLCLGCGRAPSPTDSAVVQANSRRYVLRLHTVTPVAGSDKGDYRVTLTVKR